MIFTSHGHEYQVSDIGVISQVKPVPFKYDVNYVDTYNTEAYKRQSEILQALRLGFVTASHGRSPQSLIDYGYGNGAFLLTAKQAIPEVYGLDVTGIQVKGCEIISELKEVEVITFFDSLEHIPDLSFVKELPCKTVVISLPHCHYHTEGQVWFNTKYKHRKPNEHLYHFNPSSLRLFMMRNDWIEIAQSNIEDIVRKSEHGLPNILTMAFQR